VKPRQLSTVQHGRSSFLASTAADLSGAPTVPMAPPAKTAFTGPTGTSLPPSKGSVQPQDVTIRAVTSAEYWAMADMHGWVFYPNEPPGAMHEFVRLDRVVAINSNRRRAKQSKGAARHICLVACGPSARVYWPSPDDPPPGSTLGGSGSGNGRATGGDGSSGGAGQQTWGTDGTAGRVLAVTHRLGTSAARTVAQWQWRGLCAYWGFWKKVLPGPYTEGLGVDVAAAGLLGAVEVDTLGEYLPKTISWNGRELDRERVAYCSNLAVTKHARRNGLAMRLLQHVEQEAAAWGCEALALHVRDSNDAGFALYERAGYSKCPRRTTTKFSLVEALERDKTMLIKDLTDSSIGII